MVVNGNPLRMTHHGERTRGGEPDRRHLWRLRLRHAGGRSNEVGCIRVRWWLPGVCTRSCLGWIVCRLRGRRLINSRRHSAFRRSSLRGPIVVSLRVGVRAGSRRGQSRRGWYCGRLVHRRRRGTARHGELPGRLCRPPRIRHALRFWGASRSIRAPLWNSDNETPYRGPPPPSPGQERARAERAPKTNSSKPVNNHRISGANLSLNGLQPVAWRKHSIKFTRCSTAQPRHAVNGVRHGHCRAALLSQAAQQRAKHGA